MAGPVEVGSATFDAEVLQSGVPVLVDFWASWCMPCKALAPTLEALAAELGPALKVAKVNLDLDQALAGKYRVMSIPTLMLFKGGAMIGARVGVVGKDELKRWVMGLIQ